MGQLGAVVGIALVATGTLLLEERVGGRAALVELLWTWWPITIVLLLLPGLATFMAPHRIRPGGRLTPIGGTAFLASAFAFVQVLKLNVAAVEAVRDVLLPSALMLLGILLVVRRPAAGDGKPSVLETTAFGRRLTVRSASGDLRLVRVRSILSDLRIDMRTTMLEDGLEIHATIFAGRVEVALPADSSVANVVCVGRHISIDSTARKEMGASPRVNIRALGWLGAVTVVHD